MERLTPTTAPMAAKVCSRLSYIWRAMASFSGVMARGRPPLRPGPGGGEPSSGAFSDELSFELGQCPEQMERQAPRWRRRVDTFGQALEADAGGGQVVHGGDQMAEVAPEAVQAPHHKGVTGAEVVEDGFELGAVVEGAGRLVRPNPYAAGLFQRVGL